MTSEILLPLRLRRMKAYQRRSLRIAMTRQLLVVIRIVDRHIRFRSGRRSAAIHDEIHVIFDERRVLCIDVVYAALVHRPFRRPLSILFIGIDDGEEDVQKLRYICLLRVVGDFQSHDSLDPTAFYCIIRRLLTLCINIAGTRRDDAGHMIENRLQLVEAAARDI